MLAKSPADAARCYKLSENAARLASPSAHHRRGPCAV